VSALLALPALSATAYFLLALAAGVRRWRRRQSEARDGFQPAISILKPVRGRDPRFLEAIRSYARQDYPAWELLFGVPDPDDPALADIRQLQREFPQRTIEIIASRTVAPNGKVGVLIDLARAARHPLLLISDSDIAAPPGYLREVAGPLADPSVGLVTCLYRASAETTPARWEALGVSTEFAPSVLVAELSGLSGFALGSTMVVRAADLKRLGGFERLRDYLADDFHLGRLVNELGLRVHLSQTVVETHLGGSTWGEVWNHAVRWSRTIRMTRRAGYYGYAITQGTCWAVLAGLAGYPALAAACLGTRLAAGLFIGGLVLDDRAVWRQAWAIPLRDLWGAAVWLAGLFGDTVRWRGLAIRLTADGRILAARDHSSRI